MQAEGVHMEERHLGLHMPAETRQHLLDNLASLVEEHLDLDQILEIAASAQVPQPLASPQKPPGLQNGKQHVRIAVAQDAAFAFYYYE